MTTLDHDTFASPRVSTRPALATRLVAVVMNQWRFWKNRRAFYRLGELSDAELHDIGLTRADLSVAGGLDFGEDRTRYLGSIAEARAAGAEAAARMVG
ncbi:MAG: DUF1127 domain-containing protein [Rhizobiaceae bacterium]|nr:DUF1127 domain-containing protein [Rhizobiaceae bacterium]